MKLVLDEWVVREVIDTLHTARTTLLGITGLDSPQEVAKKSSKETAITRRISKAIDIIQQSEKPDNKEKLMNFFVAVGDCGFSQHDILLLKNIWKEAGCPTPKPQVADASKMEQQEPVKGKFVFPKYLYARTKDNKTIDMSYAPQDMTAVEYIRNDFVEQEQPEVELDREITRIWGKCAAEPNDQIACLHIESFIELARHFYELGLNARKEE